MGLLERAVGGAVTLRDGLANPTPHLMEALVGGSPTKSSRLVSPDSAESMVAVYAAISILADSVAGLPLPLYRRLRPEGRERVTDHPVWRLLNDAFNPECEAFVGREMLTSHLYGWGNAWAEKEFDGSGRVVALWPILPNRVAPWREGGRFWWVVTRDDGTRSLLRREQVFHLRLRGDIDLGWSPIRKAREAIGLALAAEEFGARLFANDARPSVVYTHPKTLSDTARANLRKSLEERHEGLSNAHRMALLEEGMDVKAITIPPEDAQFLETRSFQLGEVERLYRLPPFMLADTDRSTSWGTGIGQQQVGFVQFTLASPLHRWESATRHQLLTPAERREMYGEHLVDALMRGDPVARWQAYAQARQWGVLSANDVRIRENLDPVEGGDAYLVPLNMIPADQAGDSADATARSLLAAAMRVAAADPIEAAARLDAPEAEEDAP